VASEWLGPWEPSAKRFDWPRAQVELHQRRQLHRTDGSATFAVPRRCTVGDGPPALPAARRYRGEAHPTSMSTLEPHVEASIWRVAIIRFARLAVSCFFNAWQLDCIVDLR
jgi:hypothetical protein